MMVMRMVARCCGHASRAASQSQDRRKVLVPKANLRITLALAMAVLLPGCANYYFLTTEYVSADVPIDPPEILETKEYTRRLGTVQVLAVQAPDRCIQEGAAARSGQQKEESSLMQTNCGVHLADIERGLVRNGYQVVSWKELWLTQVQDKISPRDAAIKLNADAIFLVNSLELSSVSQGENARWERRFYESSTAGDQEGSAMVDEPTKKQFLKLLRKKERTLQGNKRLSATINATMIMTKTGRSIWFYEWTLAEEKAAEMKGDLHVSCADMLCQKADMAAGASRKRKLSSGDTEALSTQGRSADVIRAIHDRLMASVIKDLVARFAAG
jgi:hypothetical protein